MSILRIVQKGIRSPNVLSRSFTVSKQNWTYAPSVVTPKFIVPADLTSFGDYKRAGSQIPVTNADAAKAPGLVALHARLQLPESFELATLARSLTFIAEGNQYADNAGMALFGKNLVKYYVTEYLMVHYPRLPAVILRAALNAYTGEETLAQIAREWGVEADNKSEMEKFLVDEPKEFSLGRLSFDKVDTNPERGVTVVEGGVNVQQAAFASVVKSVIAGVHAHNGADAAKQFIHDHVISRHIDISQMFQFQFPTRELTNLCSRQSLEPPVARLLAETGRLTVSPVFVIGIFSGSSKLGEGQGNSLLEAKSRAAVNALKNYYLYRPIDPVVPSDPKYDGSLIDGSAVVI
ncbi:hypothetical protein BABINDRAFT_56797 [Babjeviella inositovora NRRL Y-12698]|uniref:Large ribosomal subunit protein mL44 n=1 Tax=Babjeviella inositovora NRRL Y-12698 TaxID=984486 RepID=A0A1E3R0B1_9ASCO|nr:uncharacterized protein BABINDRAFT_56797 [Babjeviella inositovora NRRL Y-12698]ODQ82807.1 hypothetical protein BABINDRAFT_56797 [Babjeviella inositovora NRRL Y-12698]